MIRTLLIASLATLAAAEAEPKADADPYLVYGGYPYTHGLTYGAYNPYYPINYGYYGHPLTHYYGKREAEPTADADADAKADPWLAYSGYAGYPYSYGHLPYYGHPVVTKKVVKAADGEEKAVVPLTLPYGGLYNYGYGYTGYPVVKSVAGKTIVSPIHSGLHYYGKRSADAEPEAAAAADPWLTYGYSGYGHGLYRPYGYRAHYGGYLGGYGGYRTYGYPYYG